MDVTAAFDSDVGNKSFNNLSSLQELLSEFSRKYGVKYKVSNSLRYNEGDPRKQSLVYTMAVFSCVLKRARQCPSSFRIEVRKGALQVVHRMMQHNHGKIAGDPEPVTDLTEQFNAHFSNAKLTSFAAVMAKVKAFEESTGSEFRVGRSDLFKAGEKEKEIFRYRRITYECIHYGQRKTLARFAPATNSQGSGSARLGCMAKFDVRYAPKGFKISAVVMKHNHEVSTSTSAAAGRFCRRKTTQYHQRRCLDDELNTKDQRGKDDQPEEDQMSNGHNGATPYKPKDNSSGTIVSEENLLKGEEEKSSTTKKALSTSPSLPVHVPTLPSRSFDLCKPSPAPQPYWIANPATLLTHSLPLENPRNRNQSGANIDGNAPRELSQSERRLLLSGKMQRVLDKACHGDAKRFQECNDLLDDLERGWAKEDSMV